MKRFTAIVLSAAMLAMSLSGCASSGSSAGTAGANTMAESSAETAGETKETQAESVQADAGQSADAVSGASANQPSDQGDVEAQAAELVYQNENGETVVSHKYGETIMPENPQRIVCIKMEDIALALGVENLVACRNFETFYLEDEVNALGVGTISVDEEANTINFEQVLSYEPDLIIIRDSFEQSIYDELSKIAPTIAFRLQAPKVAMLAMGRALGIEDRAKERLQQYYDKIASAKEALQDVAGEEVAMLRILQKEIRLYPYSSNDMSSFLYLDLGLTPDPMAVEYDNADSLAISMETLPDLTAKHIFLIAGYGSQTAEAVEAAKQRYEEIKADPLWQAVPAVQSGSIYEVDSRTWLTHGIIATEMRIDQVLDYLGQ